MHEDALSPEFKYFGSDVFSNVYDGEKKIEMPKSLQILGFSDDKDPGVPKAHENYVSGERYSGIFLGFSESPIVTRFSSQALQEAVRPVQFSRRVLDLTGRFNRSP